MESRLMDVNTSAIKRRNEVSAGLDSGDYPKVMGALYSLNALLPERHEDDGRQKYRITISDSLYAKFIKHTILITCKHCTKEMDFETIKVYDLIIPMFESFLSSDRSEKVWVCPKCKKDNKLRDSDMTENVPKEPFFIRVVPKPPQRGRGMQGRATYDTKFIEWAWTFMQEWEASMAQFRDDNWQKEEQVFFGSEGIDGGEEND